MTLQLLIAETSASFTANHAMVVVGALATVVTVLWSSLRSFQEKMFIKQEHEITETRSKVDKCEEKHEHSDAKIIELTARVCQLEGREQGVKELAQALLEAVQAANVSRTEPREEAGGALPDALRS